MAATFSFPGVHIVEVPSGVRTITGVATSITAFVGRALQGPTDRPVTIQSYGDFERIFGGLWVDSALGYAVRDFYRNGGATAIIVRLANGGTASTVSLPTGTTLAAANVGKWGATLTATVDRNTSNPGDATLFNLTIKQAGGATEVFRNVSVTPTNPRFVTSVLLQSSELARASAVGAAAPTAVADKPFTGGSDGAALTSAQFVGAGMQGNRQGIYQLEKVDLFNLLVIPPYNAGNVDAATVTDAAKYCEEKRAFYILDSLLAWDTVAKAVTGMADPNANLGTNSTNAAAYFPRLRQANPMKDNLVETFAASGAVAGVFARTDATRGVWKAPAGQDAVLNGVPELTVNLTDPNIGELNPLGLNCLKTMTGIGRVVWGARTLQGADRLASEWKYIPVRRLTLFIEESLYRGTQWAVFEPNDEPLWAQLRLNVGAFMRNLFRQGAFQGGSPREAYFVKCDKETTTQNDINLGIVNVLVGFAPLKPAEFVVIRIQQMAGQVEV